MAASTSDITTANRLVYADKFYDANATSTKRIAANIEKRGESWLLELGVDEYDAGDIVDALKKVRLLH